LYRTIYQDVKVEQLPHYIIELLTA